MLPCMSKAVMYSELRFYRAALNARRSSHEKAVCVIVTTRKKDLSRFYSIRKTADHLA